MDETKPLFLAGHQPHYLPWVGYFNKIYGADKFCLVDSVQFRKKYFQHRNKIKTKNGVTWLIVPVKSKSYRDLTIADIEIDKSSNWARKHWKTIEFAYSKSLYFNEYAPFFKDAYNKKWDKLVDINEHLLRGILEMLGIEKEIVRSSVIGAKGAKTDLIIDMTKKLDCGGYISGSGGKNYVDLDKFKHAGLEHKFQDFEHPVYPQLHGEFIPNMAVIDLLFNCGPESIKYIKGENE